MAQVTAKYETIFIVDPNFSEEATAAVVEKFQSLIEANGTLGEVDLWGKKKLAYAINDMTEGYYARFTFESKPEFPAELDRIYRITDGVMRSLIIAK